MNELQQAPDLAISEEKTHAMRRVALVENPASGQASPRRKAIVRATLAALQEAGFEEMRRQALLAGTSLPTPWTSAIDLRGSLLRNWGYESNRN